MITDPEILTTFHRDGIAFISRDGGAFISCPPYVIASVAAGRVPPGALDLPAGYDLHVLEQIKANTGWVCQDVRVSPRQARELAGIGKQILNLQATEPSKIDPPLGYYEEQVITHLVDLVGSTLG